MRTFHCTQCGQQVFFEHTRCAGCGRTLAFLPDAGAISPLDCGDDGLWRPPGGLSGAMAYRLCANYGPAAVCNWAVDAADASSLCRSCRLTRVIPDLSMAGTHDAWARVEDAKRRFLVNLTTLGLSLTSGPDGTSPGLAFEFLGEDAGTGEGVTTGHRAGVVTIDIAEADDPERERRRAAVREPYRTLLGHVRHESGHYFWERLLSAPPALDAFRSAFGDERRDYRAALDAYYQLGPPPDWRDRFVSAYASAHPWEDWAETWAHYLHMTDAIDTAAACGLSLTPEHSHEPTFERLSTGLRLTLLPFDELSRAWVALSYGVNSLNRSLGLADAYPFLPSSAALEKVRFVHTLVGQHARWD